MNFIHLSEVLQKMKEDKPYSMTVVTCDINRNSGGEILSLKKCFTPIKEKLEKLDIPLPFGEFERKPNHYEHATRNVMLENGHVKKIHIRLILEFNGQKVFY